MKVMYIKYKEGIRDSIIKDDETITMSSTKIIALTNVKKIKEPIYTCTSANNEVISLSNLDYKINEEITNFFFDAVHKNYLKNKKNTL